MLKESEKEWLDRTIKKVTDKIDKVSVRSRFKIPYITIDGIHDDRSTMNPTGGVDDGICWWTNGFWSGIMWLLYVETNKSAYKEIAQYAESKLDKCFHIYEGLHHDVGFMWQPSSVASYMVTKNQESRKRALHAANLLAGRFNLAGGFIRAWNDIEHADTRGWAIIDCMLNLPLLYWASAETGDPRYKQIAMRHADTVLATFIREDGSVHHIVEYDPFNGGVVNFHGGQGFSVGSSWTRGQAWAIYGFMMSYYHTKKVDYLDTAKRVAQYFIQHIPESYIIPVDFKQPASPRREDDTAAAIAACGFIELAKVSTGNEKETYLTTALALLMKLDADRCDWAPETDGILQYGSSAYHANEHHQSIIYGDYFFIESLLKLRGNELYIW